MSCYVGVCLLVLFYAYNFNVCVCLFVLFCFVLFRLFVLFVCLVRKCFKSLLFSFMLILHMLDARVWKFVHVYKFSDATAFVCGRLECCCFCVRSR